jgi:hypothetical protein
MTALRSRSPNLGPLRILANSVTMRGNVLIQHGNALQLLPDRKIALRSIALLYGLTLPTNASMTIGTLAGYSDDERRVAQWAYMTAPPRAALNGSVDRAQGRARKSADRSLTTHTFRSAEIADYRHVAAYLRKMHERTWLRQPYTHGVV